MWVHVMDPPLKCMKVACAKQIGNSIGSFVEWDRGPGNLVWGKKLRLRVELDLDLPLMRGIKMFLHVVRASSMI